MTKYLKVKQYAEMRQISPWTVYRMVERDSNEIEFERSGRAIRIVVREPQISGRNFNWEDFSNGRG